MLRFSISNNNDYKNKLLREELLQTSEQRIQEQVKLLGKAVMTAKRHFAKRIKIQAEKQSPKKTPEFLVPASPQNLTLKHIQQIGKNYFSLYFNHQLTHDRFHYAHCLENFEMPEIELQNFKNKEEKDFKYALLPSAKQLLWEKLIAFYIILPTADGYIASSIDAIFNFAFNKYLPEGQVIKTKLEGDLMIDKSPSEIALDFRKLLVKAFREIYLLETKVEMKEVDSPRIER